MKNAMKKFANKLYMISMSALAMSFISTAMNATTRCAKPMWFEEPQMPTALRDKI